MILNEEYEKERKDTDNIQIKNFILHTNLLEVLVSFLFIQLI
jgi:hypothetical protein